MSNKCRLRSPEGPVRLRMGGLKAPWKKSKDEERILRLTTPKAEECRWTPYAPNELRWRWRGFAAPRARGHFRATFPGFPPRLFSLPPPGRQIAHLGALVDERSGVKMTSDRGTE